MKVAKLASIYFFFSECLMRLNSQENRIEQLTIYWSVNSVNSVINKLGKVVKVPITSSEEAIYVYTLYL